MTKRVIRSISILVLALTRLASADALPLVVFAEHRISLRIEPADHSADVEDIGTLICSKGWNLIYLKDSALVNAFTVGGQPQDFVYAPDGDTSRLPLDLRSKLSGMALRPDVALLVFEASSTGTVPFRMSYSARFEDPVDNVQFSRENVGNEVNGSILERGAYLSAGACYYPQGADALARFALRADIPAAWEAIADGNRVSTEMRGDRKVQHFENPFSSEGYVFMAAPYVIKTVTVESIRVATYFFEADTSLCEKYLAATTDYIRMYQELIGPYPFKQFTVAENFFPTGYGMPGWTLLGQSVLRLPFIITSSLGHEVLHNWWGNTVYVDYDRGNWCEAAAVYGADYRYKLLASAEAARDYRKDVLKEYLSYVNAGNDFPLREFTSRSSAETRTIGYNKGMMVFHLIEQQIGSGPFFDAWKQVYREHRGRAISWEEWMAAFQKVSGQNLSHIIPQWIDRPGAPELGLKIAAVKPAEISERKIVTLQISQSNDAPYQLSVPIHAEGPNVVESTIVQLTAAEATADFSVPAAVRTISVDPDYHLFRRLYPEEVEPIVSAVLGVTEKRLVSYESDKTLEHAFGSFGAALTEDSAVVLPSTQLDAMPRDGALILLNPTPLPEYLAGLLGLSADSVTISGQTYARHGHTLVMAGQKWNGFERYLVILTADHASLLRVGQLVPHYGKYSYLVFAGDKNVAKGQWPVTESPLREALP